MKIETYIFNKYVPYRKSSAKQFEIHALHTQKWKNIWAFDRSRKIMCTLSRHKGVPQIYVQCTHKKTNRNEWRKKTYYIILYTYHSILLQTIRKNVKLRITQTTCFLIFLRIFFRLFFYTSGFSCVMCVQRKKVVANRCVKIKINSTDYRTYILQSLLRYEPM